MKNLISSKGRLLFGIGVLFAIISISSSCTKSAMDNMAGMTTGPGTKGTGAPGANEVWIEGSAFNPPTITVAAGTTIKWTNKDGVVHDVTSTTGVFTSGAMNNGATFSFTFNNSGTFPYLCTLHPTMTASVTVN